jgi:alkanesulfonate monooxygenase SsuD/methylene tetrahydromethanopterin reductase-like flavin-dependent oxidoreductase (luciferase family)
VSVGVQGCRDLVCVSNSLPAARAASREEFGRQGWGSAGAEVDPDPFTVSGYLPAAKGRAQRAVPEEVQEGEQGLLWASRLVLGPLCCTGFPSCNTSPASVEAWGKKVEQDSCPSVALCV